MKEGTLQSSRLIQTEVGDQRLVRRRHWQLVTAATRLFEKRGFHATSISEISRASGLSVGTIYRYVRKKEDILLLILDAIVDGYREELAKQPPVADPVERLRQAVRAILEVTDRYDTRTLLAYREAWALDRVGRRHVLAVEEAANRILQSIIEDGIRQGAFRPVDPYLAAFNIRSLIHMWALKRAHLRKRLTVDQFLERQLDFILAALGVRDLQAVSAGEAGAAGEPEGAGGAP